MSDRNACPVCAAPVPAKTGSVGPPRKYCSKRCRRWYARHLGGSPCSVDGCGKPKTSQGLCPAHYIQKFYPDRHGVEMVACTGCGAMVEKSTSRNKSRRVVCSYRCRYFVTHGKWPNAGKELVGPVRFAKSTTAPMNELPATRRGFLSVECKWCGEEFIHDWRVTGVTPKYCASRCSRRAARARHELSRGRFDIPKRARVAIYERDDWICQLCMEPVDPDTPVGDAWSASLDHIIPQSHTLIPDHSPANLRLAHLWCNSVRGDESYYTAADLAV